MFYELKNGSALFCDAQLWLSCSFIKMNESFFVSFSSFNEQNERIDLGKDSTFFQEDLLTFFTKIFWKMLVFKQLWTQLILDYDYIYISHSWMSTFIACNS